MGENSAIEWTHHTFNPWIGCARVSPGCTHCYAEHRVAPRQQVTWGKTGDRRVTSDGYWRQPHRWDRQAERDGVRHRVFCASLADVFEDRPDLDEPRQRLWDLVTATPHLDWLLLTKRPENVLRMVDGWVIDPTSPADWPANVWIGTSVEDQQRADERLPVLARIPAAVRFVSAEPLLGPVDLGDHVQSIDWLIVGGETGSGARPMHPQWARDLVEQCLARTEPCEIPDVPRPHSVPVPGGGRACACEYPDPVAVHFKQWGDWAPTYVVADADQRPPATHHLLDTGQLLPLGDRLGMNHMARPVQVALVGKKLAGRTLDGRTWDDLPTPRTATATGAQS